jgi:hypothetical protein
MNPSNINDEKLSRLLGDVLTEDEVTPEQMVQYAEKPETLSAEERMFIEAAIAASPALNDELRVLKSFALPGAAHTHSHTHHHSQSQAGLIQQLADTFSSLFGNMLIPAGAMAVIALSVAIVVVMNKTEQQPDGYADSGTTQVTPKNITPTQTTETTQPEQVLADNVNDTKPVNDNIDTHEPVPAPQNNMLMLAMVEPQYHSGYAQDAQVVIRGETAQLKCLAPAMANTASPQPVLYWTLSATKPGASLQLELSNANTGEIILEKTLNMPATAGVQKIALGEYNIFLQENIVYQWTVILQTDASNPALDKFDSARIKYLKPDSTQHKSLAAANINTRPNIYAKQGYWYDALSEIMIAKEKHPDNHSVARAYDALMAQTGIKR